MFKFAVVAFVAMASLSALALGGSDECADFPKPSAEHQWLQQLAGDWDYDLECVVPGQPATKSKGRESVRAVGGFWTIAEHTGSFLNAPFTGVLTLGYDAEHQRYVGTWIDSMSDHLWNYTGSVNGAGNALTLETEGPSCTSPGKLARFREVIEVKSKDHKVFRASVQGEDGGWTTMLTIDYRRAK